MKAYICMSKEKELDSMTLNHKALWYSSLFDANE